MSAEPYARGLLDTGVLILRDRIDAESLPADMSISAVTLAELSAGPHHVRPGVAEYEEHAERARRTDVLQRAENQFDPIPFDANAARIYGRVSAAVLAAGRSPRARIADLMIASVAIAAGMPLFTTNPDDFAGLDELLVVVPVVPRPESPPHRDPSVLARD